MFKWTVAGLAAMSCCIAVHAKGRGAKGPPPLERQVVQLSSDALPTPVRPGVPEAEPASLSPPAMVDTPPHAALRWEVRPSDITLARTLERWAMVAGHKLKWDASRNFLIGASDVYLGSFEGALQQVLSSSGIRFSDYPLEACIYTNTPPLVRITRQGEQARECVAATAP
jgi:hypothetical protein